MNISAYKKRFHFSVNFYSLFLVATFLPDLAGIGPSAVTLPYWIIKVVLAILVILTSRKTFFRLTGKEILFLVTALIFGLNIFADVFLARQPVLAKHGTTQGLLDCVGFFLGIIIAMSFRYDPVYHRNKSFYFFWVTLSIALTAAFFLAVPNFRLDVANTRYDANSSINSIMYGQTGCALALISIFGFVNHKAKMKILFVVTFLLGLLSIAKAGSRSPVIVIIAVSVFYFFAKNGNAKGVVFLVLFSLLFIVLLNPIIDLLQAMGSNLAVRISNIFVEGDTSGRDSIYKHVLQIIAEAPLLGAYYIIPYGMDAGSYPHNFFLEVFMNTGIVGGIPFVLVVIQSVLISYRTIRAGHPSGWIVILYLQILVYGMFSTGLYTSQDFWALLFYIISMRQFNVATAPVRQISEKKYERRIAGTHTPVRL